MQNLSSQNFSSGIAALDNFLGGAGLLAGGISEWGMPSGQFARLLVLRFLAHNRPFCLWIYHDSEDALVYPPAWQCVGVDLSRTYFVQASKPLEELKAFFIDPLFRCLVIDSPQGLRAQELAFIAYHMRRNQQIVILLRPYFLSHAYPTPLARVRINCRYQTYPSGLRLELLRGGAAQNLFLPIESFWRSFVLSEEVL